MKDLFEFLQRLAGAGELVTLAYSGGSRFGQPRQITITSCSETEFRAYEPGSRIQKQYKIAKILWAEDSTGRRITSKCHVQEFQSVLPEFETLQQYADYLRPELQRAGWYIHEGPNMLGVGTCFKNGKPRKTPSIAVAFFVRSTDLVWDIECDDLVEVKRESTGQERPWRVDSWRFKEGKSFRLLHSAVEMFLSEVRDSDPQLAKGMFAGH